jgi:hypothetical protein
MSSCGARKTVQESALYMSQPTGNGSITVWGVVPDQVLEVEGVEVVENTFAFHGSQRRTLTLVTQSGRRLLDMGS